VRIIAGAARGTKLETASVPALRPMLDRVKEALFNIIRADVPGARVLDLFSGSGALGLEALSRGAAGCVFVERHPALAELAMRNAARCKAADRCEMVVADFFELGRRAAPAGLPATLVFADPPYEVVDDPNRRTEFFACLEGLGGAWISCGALVVVHHRPIPHAVWPVSGLRQVDRRVYGRSQLTFFEAHREEHIERGG